METDQTHSLISVICLQTFSRMCPDHTPYIRVEDEWRGKPSFHTHLKRSFPLGICMWEDLVFYASSEMDPEMHWLERSPNFPAEASCMLIVHITRWKDVWVPGWDATESPRPPLHLKNGPNMPLTTRKPRGVHCFKFWRCLTFF